MKSLTMKALVPIVATPNDCKFVEITKFEGFTTLWLVHKSGVDFAIEFDLAGPVTFYAFEGHYQEPLGEKAFEKIPTDFKGALATFIKSTLGDDLTKHVIFERGFNA